jgi:photosynthetic reaction center H subunit
MSATTSAITHNFDLAQIVLYLFWIFFASLCVYLHRENKREGYPLENTGGGSAKMQGWPAVPEPKSFKISDSEIRYAPGPNSDLQTLTGATRTSVLPGAPIVPDGAPLQIGVGPGAYADRRDLPDLTIDGAPRIVPLRVAGEGYSVDEKDPDPRGKPVVGADNVVGGTVTDLWIDRSEAVFRYLEATVDTPTGPRSVLVPINFTRINHRQVKLASILGAQLAGVPGLKNPEIVTSLEEDKITAYYGAGTLYATPARQEPIL